tara:strand:+ start:1652 stop:2050 length:399 start_codon:yes stop_codon:yes gene_type:complete
MKDLRRYIRKVLKEMKQATPTYGWGGNGWPGSLPARKTQKAWQRRFAKQERPFWSSEGRDKLIDIEGNVYEIGMSTDAPIKVKRTDLRSGDTYTITKSYFGGWNVEGGGYDRLFDELHGVAEFLSEKVAIVI